METKKLKGYIIRILLGLIVAFAVSEIAKRCVYQISQGPTPFFDLGNNYRMESWPGYISHSPNPETTDYSMLISEPIETFGLQGPWLVGKTEKGWFVINKETNSIVYPCEKKEVFKVSGLSEKEILINEMPKSLRIIFPHTIDNMKKMKKISVFFLVAFPLVFLLVPLKFK